MVTAVCITITSYNITRNTELTAVPSIQVLDLGAMANPMFKGKGPGMIAGNFAPNFPLKHAQKDMK
jgi:3-hydroxyisobutyrate dehydrogenase-like beta-hydroxyacid dehydrogenase